IAPNANAKTRKNQGGRSLTSNTGGDGPGSGVGRSPMVMGAAASGELRVNGDAPTDIPLVRRAECWTPAGRALRFATHGGRTTGPRAAFRREPRGGWAAGR